MHLCASMYACVSACMRVCVFLRVYFVRAPVSKRAEAMKQPYET